MDAEGCKKEPNGTDPEIFWHVRQKLGNVDQMTRDVESWRLAEVFLSGGAPWGFTLRGGLEHREPLLITKVEEGSRASAVSLQVGDELVNINEIPLSGYRQEAICLIKGSHKTLSLVVKRQNEPISRPHSWHSTKFNENQADTAKTQSPPTTVWNKRYDASSSIDLSTTWEQTNLCRVSDQFSSLGSMDSLEHVSHPYPAGQLTPAKSTNSTEHLGGGKRDSAYSSFSASSGTPDYTLSKSNAASTENMLHKVSQWDAAGKHNNCRHSQNLPTEGVKQDDWVTYFQIPGVNSMCEGPQIDDPADNRQSASSRTSFGPVWNVPEKKKTTSPSPPPPPPARRDSFAATKVHEKGMVVVHLEGSDKQASFKAPFEHVHSHNNCQRSDSDCFNSSFGKCFHNQFASNKQYSLTSTDVRQGQPSQVSQSQHQKQLSDKSSVCPHPWATSIPKPHNVGGHFCSLQELPTNGSEQQFNQKKSRNLSSSLSSTCTDQTTESNLQKRYYCDTTCQSTQLNQLSLSGVPEDTKSTTASESTQNINEQTSLIPLTTIKVRYNMLQPQHPSHDIDNNGYSKNQVSAVLETSVLKPKSDGHSTQNALYMNYPFSRQSEQHRSLLLQNRELPRDSRPHSQVSNKICPQTTPMLHSLSVDDTDPNEKMKDTNLDECFDNKQVKHSERFATTLRNEIQMRRARLQKSQSAAAVPDEAEENQDIWKSTDCPTPSSSDGSFSNIYKDHLKEAQARVLKATSFRRRDLDPVLQDHATGEALNNHQASTQRRNKDVVPLPIVTELVTDYSGTSDGQFARVGGRKRFSAEKKMKSFSEPDKIHEVGMKENLALSDKAMSSLDQQKLFQESEQLGFPCDVSLCKPTQDQGQDAVLTNARMDLVKGIRGGKNKQEAWEVPYSTCSPSIQDQQSFGIFSEYGARWNIQKKPPEKRASGPYQSADNILHHGPEERNKSDCFHERSRSSPSADLYGQKIPVSARKSEPQYSQMERKPAEPLVTDTWLSDRRPGDCKVIEKPGEFEYCPLPQLPPMTGASPECAYIDPPVTVSHKSTSNSHSLVESDDNNRPELPPTPRKKPSMLEKPPQPRCPEVGNTHQLLAASESEAPIHCSAQSDPSSSFGPTHPSGNSNQGKEAVDKGQGAAHHPSTSIPLAASSPLASSHRPVALASMEGQRSPSPQFSPQRLSDKPPLPICNEDSKRMVHVIESQNTTVRKVPIRIVCSERSTDKDNCPFLQQSESPVVAADYQGSARLTCLGAAGTDSVFCTFTRQRKLSNTSVTQAQLPPQTDTYIGTLMDQEPTAEHPNNNKDAVTDQLIKEDQKREALARDIVGKDKSLADILDQSKMKTTMDLMHGIFPKGEQLLEGAHQHKKAQMKQTNPRPAEEREKEDSNAAAVTMVTSSTYYSTSAPKAELLIKMKDMQEQEEEKKEENSEDELDIDLANKKQELINSLNKKLQVLQEARESLQEDIQDNNALGDELEAHIQQVCKPNELDKFRMFVGDLDKVVSLLLSLSGRLARVENAINSLEEDATPEERHTLIEKRKLLIQQHNDAKELKENLDRRERIVYDILAKYLPDDSLTDYEHFVKMKSALIIEQRKLEDKIKLGEEQLKCLVDSLPVEQQLAL